MGERHLYGGRRCASRCVASGIVDARCDQHTSIGPLKHLLWTLRLVFAVLVLFWNPGLSLPSCPPVSLLFILSYFVILGVFFSNIPCSVFRVSLLCVFLSSFVFLSVCSFVFPWFRVSCLAFRDSQCCSQCFPAPCVPPTMFLNFLFSLRISHSAFASHATSRPVFMSLVWYFSWH